MSEENKSVDDYFKELRAVLTDPESLNYDDVMTEMNVAYKALSMVSEKTSENESEEEAKAAKIKELSTIMNSLGEIAKAKKPKKVVTKSANKPETAAKTIPAPVFDEPAEKKSKMEPPEVKAEAEIKSAVSSTEPTREEIMSGYTKEDTTKTVVNNTQVNINVEQHEIPKPVFEEPSVVEQTSTKKEEVTVGEYKDATIVAAANEVPKTEASATEDQKSTMELDTPSVESQIFVSDAKDVEDQVKGDVEEKQLDYSFLESKPFEGDDDIDVEGDADLANIELETKPTADEERIRKITEEFSSIPDGMRATNVKAISRAKISETIKALQKINTEGMDIDKIGMFDYKDSDEVIRREYLKTRNDMIANPKISRISLLMSGHYEEISAYGNYDLTGIQRLITNPDTSFVDREMSMLNSIYSHVKYVSYASEKPSFEDWCKNIAYPDMGSLYFAVYDANSVGENNYNFGCPYCGADVTIAKKNRDLTVAVPKELTQDKLEQFITCKDVMKLDSTQTSKWAKTTTVRKQLPDSKIIVDYKVPTIYDYLTVLNTAQRISRRDMNDSLDLSSIDIFSSSSSGNEEDAMRILAYLYVNAIGIPAKVEGTNKFRYIKLTNKGDIIEHINSLSLKDYNTLFTGQKVQDLMVKSATKYYVEDVQCTNQECGKTIKYVSLDPKQILFFKIGEEMSRLMM